MLAVAQATAGQRRARAGAAAWEREDDKSVPAKCDDAKVQSYAVPARVLPNGFQAPLCWGLSARGCSLRRLCVPGRGGPTVRKERARVAARVVAGVERGGSRRRPDTSPSSTAARATSTSAPQPQTGGHWSPTCWGASRSSRRCRLASDSSGRCAPPAAWGPGRRRPDGSAHEMDGRRTN